MVGPRARAPAPARCLRTGGRRPFLPALHRARRRRASGSRGWCDEFLGERRRAGARRRAAAASPTARGSPSGRCSRPSRRRSGSTTATHPTRRGAKLARALGGEQGAEVVAQRVAEMIGLAEVAGGAEDGFGAVRALFETLARDSTAGARLRRHPLGRAHVPRPRRAHRRLRRATRPILLVCLARPELLDVPPGLGRRQAERDVGAARAALGRRVRAPDREPRRSQAELAEEVETRIAEAAEGNPLFVEEMLLDADRRRSARPRGRALGGNRRSRRRAACRRRSRRCSPPASTGSTQTSAP